MNEKCSLIFKNNEHTVTYAFILMWFLKIVTQRSKFLIPVIPCSKHFGKLPLRIAFWRICKPDKTIHLITFYLHFIPRSIFLFFNSPELAINVSLKWWKWLKLTFKLWNLSPLRIFRSMHACVHYRHRRQFQKGVENTVE